MCSTPSQWNYTVADCSASYFVSLVPAPPWGLRALRAGALEIAQVAGLAGSAFALYGMAILLTEVATAVLLFYLIPAWSASFPVRLSPAQGR